MSKKKVMLSGFLALLAVYIIIIRNCCVVVEDIDVN